MIIIANKINISNLIVSITWEGDTTQIARRISFTYLFSNKNINVANVCVEKGDRISAYDNKMQLIFDGIVIRQEKEESDVTMSITAHDFAFYTKNKTYNVYKGTPRQVVTLVCCEFDIPIGEIADVPAIVEVISTGDKTIYQVIQAAYKNVGFATNIYMTGLMINIEKIGTRVCGTVTGDDAVLSAKYSSSIENMVNKVIVLDKNGKYASEVTKAEDIAEYGILQEVYKQSDKNADVLAESSKILKSVEDSGNITVKGSYEYVTGKSICIGKVNSKIFGKFNIISDSHSIANGEHTTTLGLNFEEVI